MANTTVYPFGTGGQLPSSIGIVNDLTTGGANQALSAEQGKVLNERFVITGNVTRYEYPEIFGKYAIGTSALEANVGYWCTNVFVLHDGETVTPPTGPTANLFATVAEENLPLTASTPITKQGDTYTNNTGADVYVIWSHGNRKAFALPITKNESELIDLADLKDDVDNLSALLSEPRREYVDVNNFAHATLRANDDTGFYAYQVAPTNRWLSTPIQLKAGDTVNIDLFSGTYLCVARFNDNSAQSTSTQYVGMVDDSSGASTHNTFKVNEDMRIVFSYATDDLKSFYIDHATSEPLSQDVIYPTYSDDHIVESGDTDLCLIMGSSLTWSGYSPKTMSWIERLNDLVDIGIVNGGHSGVNLSGNITDMTTGNINLLEMKLTKLAPRYIISNNTANSTPTGKDLDTQLKQFERVAKSVGATCLVCGEEPTLIDASKYNKQGAMTKQGINFFPTTKLWYNLNSRQSYAGWKDSNGIHTNMKNGSSHISMREMVEQLYIHKSVKFYKVRENYKAGSPTTAQLAYSNRFERSAIWRAVCTGIGYNPDPWKNDNIDNASYNINETTGVDLLTDTTKTCEVATAKFGGDITFYKHALVEIITPRVEITKAVITINCPTEPTAVGFISDGEYVATTPTYSNGVLTITLDTTNIQDYDKIMLVISNTTDSTFTLGKVKAVVYGGEIKPSYEVKYKERKVGNELMTATSVENGWAFSGNGSLEQLPSTVRNYTRLNDVNYHLQLDDDNASASYTQALDHAVHKVAVRIAVAIFPKIQTTRTSNDYTTTSQNLYRGMYYGGNVLLTINDAYIPLHIETGWSEVYAEAVIDGSSLNITLGRATSFDPDNYNVGEFPVFIHNISVQEID